jgi:hypothetical protein
MSQTDRHDAPEKSRRFAVASRKRSSRDAQCRVRPARGEPNKPLSYDIPSLLDPPMANGEARQLVSMRPIKTIQPMPFGDGNPAFGRDRIGFVDARATPSDFRPASGACRAPSDNSNQCVGRAFGARLEGPFAWAIPSTRTVRAIIPKKVVESSLRQLLAHLESYGSYLPTQVDGSRRRSGREGHRCLETRAKAFSRERPGHAPRPPGQSLRRA